MRFRLRRTRGKFWLYFCFALFAVAPCSAMQKCPDTAQGYYSKERNDIPDRLIRLSIWLVPLRSTTGRINYVETVKNLVYTKKLHQTPARYECVFDKNEKYGYQGVGWDCIDAKSGRSFSRPTMIDTVLVDNNGREFKYQNFTPYSGESAIKYITCKSPNPHTGKLDVNSMYAQDEFGKKITLPYLEFTLERIPDIDVVAPSGFSLPAL